MDERGLRELFDRAAAAVSHLPTALQPVAFAEAVRLLVGGSTGEKADHAKAASRSKRATRERRQPGTKKSRAKRTAPSLDRSLNLHPKGKASLQAFHKEKAPKSQDEHNVVFVHYLHNIASVGAVTVNQVYTC
jgi:hypothetical protein